MTHGPVMLDLQGQTLLPEERDILQHPAAGGVILFSRNYDSPGQLAELVSELHDLRRPALLIAVDQEGGRVQRFRDGFTQLPPAASFGRLYDEDPEWAEQAAHEVAWLMASELRSCGVDFSFAPVLDLGRGVSSVIGDRAFHARPEITTKLANSWMAGAREGGMPSVGKHFPGHGSVEADSHLDLPVDDRRFTDIETEDLLPFERMVQYGLDAIMPAHVIYPQVDRHLAGFSPFWLQTVLRGQLDFQGVIFSDDLTMAAAENAGSYPERARAALDAGCDMVLVCNNPQAASEVLRSLEGHNDPVSQSRLVRMHGRQHPSSSRLHQQSRWREAVEIAARLSQNDALDLDLIER